MSIRSINSTTSDGIVLQKRQPIESDSQKREGISQNVIDKNNKAADVSGRVLVALQQHQLPPNSMKYLRYSTNLTNEEKQLKIKLNKVIRAYKLTNNGEEVSTGELKALLQESKNKSFEEYNAILDTLLDLVKEKRFTTEEKFDIASKCLTDDKSKAIKQLVKDKKISKDGVQFASSLESFNLDNYDATVSFLSDKDVFSQENKDRLFYVGKITSDNLDVAKKVIKNKDYSSQDIVYITNSTNHENSEIINQLLDKKVSGEVIHDIACNTYFEEEYKNKKDLKNKFLKDIINNPKVNLNDFKETNFGKCVLDNLSSENYDFFIQVLERKSNNGDNVWFLGKVNSDNIDYAKKLIQTAPQDYKLNSFYDLPDTKDEAVLFDNALDIIQDKYGENPEEFKEALKALPNFASDKNAVDYVRHSQNDIETTALVAQSINQSSIDAKSAENLVNSFKGKIHNDIIPNLVTLVYTNNDNDLPDVIKFTVDNKRDDESILKYSINTENIAISMLTRQKNQRPEKEQIEKLNKQIEAYKSLLKKFEEDSYDYQSIQQDIECELKQKQKLDDIVMSDEDIAKYTKQLVSNKNIPSGKIPELIKIMTNSNIKMLEKLGEDKDIQNSDIQNFKDIKQETFEYMNQFVDLKYIAKNKNVAESLQKMGRMQDEEVIKQRKEIFGLISQRDDFLENSENLDSTLNYIYTDEKANFVKNMVSDKDISLKSINDILSTATIISHDKIEKLIANKDLKTRLDMYSDKLKGQYFPIDWILEHPEKYSQMLDDGIICDAMSYELKELANDDYDTLRDSYQSGINLDSVPELASQFENPHGETYSTLLKELKQYITDNNMQDKKFNHISSTSEDEKNILLASGDTTLKFSRETGKLLAVEKNNEIENLLNSSKTKTYNVINKDNLMEQPFIMNIITRDINGEEYHTFRTESDIKGEYEIYDVDSNGKRHLIGLAEYDGEGGKHVEKNLKSLDGTQTNTVYADDKEGNRFSYYEIKDKDGKILYKRTDRFKVLSDNHFMSSTNDRNYDIEFFDDKVVVTKLDKNKQKTDKTLEYKIKDFTEEPLEGITRESLNGETDVKKIIVNYTGSDRTIDREVVPLLKKLSGNEWEEMYNADTKAVFGGAKFEQQEVEIPNACSIGGAILMNKYTKDSLATFEHELGHEKFAALELHNDPEFIQTYEEEKKLFVLSMSKENIDLVDYFMSPIGDDEFRGKNETSAETNLLLNTIQDADYIQGRSIILQQYFPRTIAYIANKQEELITK